MKSALAKTGKCVLARKTYVSNLLPNSTCAVPIKKKKRKEAELGTHGFIFSSSFDS